MKNYILPVVATLILAGCTSKTKQTATTTDKPVKTAVTANACSTINSLITGYSSGFKAIKTDKVNNSFIEQWRANTHIIGTRCTVTVNKSYQASYQCQTQVNKQQQTVSKHQQLAQQLRQCLSTQGWFESQKETPNAIYSTFVLDTHTPVITLATNQHGTGFVTRFEIAPPLGRE